MPKYDYKCNDKQCGEIFEVTQSFSDNPSAFCIICGHSSRRLISKVAVHFKGSGWYSTDNRSKVKKNKTEEPKKESSKKESTAKASQKKSTNKKSTNKGSSNSTKTTKK